MKIEAMHKVLDTGVSLICSTLSLLVSDVLVERIDKRGFLVLWMIDWDLPASILVNAKRADGPPIDPVQWFHLTSEAEIFAAHVKVDASERGIA